MMEIQSLIIQLLLLSTMLGVSDVSVLQGVLSTANLIFVTSVCHQKFATIGKQEKKEYVALVALVRKKDNEIRSKEL